MGILDFIWDIGNYEDRKVNNEEIDGITISTAWTSDEGYETALCDATDKFYPVERYLTKSGAEEGHKKWCKKIKNGIETITILGGFNGLVPDEQYKLKRE